MKKRNVMKFLNEKIIPEVFMASWVNLFEHPLKKEIERNIRYCACAASKEELMVRARTIILTRHINR